MRVCYFGTYRNEYSRNQIMIEGLRRAGVEVIECHEQLWSGVEDRIEAASGGWRHPGFLWRVIRVYFRLIQQYFRLEEFDILILGYPGQLDVFLAYFLARLRHKPLVWDIFMSIYLIALERGLDQHSRCTIAALRCVERLACGLPDLLILDTEEYVNWFETTHGIPQTRFCLVPTGADERVFHPVTLLAESNGIFRVIYYGTFIQNHGVRYIIEAANMLQSEADIQFELIGDGPELEIAKETVKRYGLSNVNFVPWLPKEELVQRIANSSLCLGVFGVTPQSMMTINNKIYEALAMAKPVITGDSPTLRAAFTHGRHLYLVQRAYPQELANAIRDLHSNPELCATLSENGCSIFTDRYTPSILGLRFKSHLDRLRS